MRADKTIYNPKSKYVIVELSNGLGETWYKIKRKGWFAHLFDTWFRCYYDTDYGWTPFIPEFKSEQEAKDFLQNEHKKYIQNNLANNISITKETAYEI